MLRVKVETHGSGHYAVPAMQPFPSLVLSAGGATAQGAFAEAQAAFLDPDPATVRRLRSLLEASGAGIVAHFYMDAELQGVLWREAGGAAGGSREVRGPSSRHRSSHRASPYMSLRSCTVIAP